MRIVVLLIIACLLAGCMQRRLLRLSAEELKREPTTAMLEELALSAQLGVYPIDPELKSEFLRRSDHISRSELERAYYKGQIEDGMSEECAYIVAYKWSPLWTSPDVNTTVVRGIKAKQFVIRERNPSNTAYIYTRNGKVYAWQR